MFKKILSGLIGLFPILSVQPAEAAENQWFYQLQDADPKELSSSGYKYLVIDPTRDGKDSSRYTKNEIASIQKKGTTVLAYISIGEASAFRSYWKEQWGQQVNGALNVRSDAPAWLGRVPNPEWPESVKVRYWEDAWWNVLAPQLDKIKSAGFDGVYLDIVDAYAYWGTESTYRAESRRSGDPATREEAAQRMIKLVERIAAYMRDSDSGFKVFPQNAEGILRYDDGSYLKTISGIGTEDLWFDEDRRVNAKEISSRLAYLKKIQKAGKPVLSVDYVRVPSPSDEEISRMREYYTKCQQQGFYCYAAFMDRELDEFIPRSRNK